MSNYWDAETSYNVSIRPFTVYKTCYLYYISAALRSSPFDGAGADLQLYRDGVLYASAPFVYPFGFSSPSFNNWVFNITLQPGTYTSGMTSASFSGAYVIQYFPETNRFWLAGQAYIVDIYGNVIQPQYSVAVGHNSGNVNQSSYTVAMGYRSAESSQQPLAIAIGAFAGLSTQGDYAIAIGAQAGQTNQHANSIILNASGTALNSSTSNAFFVSPVRSTAGTCCLKYNTSTSEVSYDTAKTFVIDHPDDKNKYLVHACLEGPEAGVYYRGKGEITNNTYVEIELPDYVKNLATDFTIQITQIIDKKNPNKIIHFRTTEVEDNKFAVFGENGKFFWLIHGKRADITVEPDKANSNIKGSGPYKWI